MVKILRANNYSKMQRNTRVMSSLLLSRCIVELRVFIHRKMMMSMVMRWMLIDKHMWCNHRSRDRFQMEVTRSMIWGGMHHLSSSSRSLIRLRLMMMMLVMERCSL